MTWPVSDFKISYRGEFHLKNLYRYMFELLNEEDWCGKERALFPETFYYENRYELGTEYVWWWRVSRDPAYRTRYYRYVLDIDVHARAVKNIEVVRNGMKLKTNTGEIEISFSSRVVTDPEGFWAKHWFWQHLDKIMWKRMMKTNLIRHKMFVYRLVYKLQSDVKNYLKLMRYQPPERPFRPPLGVGRDWQP